LIGDLGQDVSLGGGDAIGTLSSESRMVIPNIMTENAYLLPDQAVFDYLEQRLRWRWQMAQAHDCDRGAVGSTAQQCALPRRALRL